MKYLACLGRQPKISLAELECLFGESVRQVAPELAVFESAEPPIFSHLGGSLKLAEELQQSPIDFLKNLPEGKITLGVSDYSKKSSARTANVEALKFKKILSRHGRSVRALANKTAVLSTATSHHNQISEKKNHVELIKFNDSWWNVVGVQNITAYANRDQARPARDAKVGMLPPKLAQILINLCGPLKENSVVLDPFCGSGVVLQEAFLMGYHPIGTDLSEKMVSYSQKNLEWLTGEKREFASQGDATSAIWPQPIHAVAAEIYLGPPMSSVPADIKLKSAKQECGSILFGFLKNLASQITSGTPVSLAIPAWLKSNGEYSRLDIVDNLEELGYNVLKLKNSDEKDLLYHREGQIVARELIILRKK